ncbi:MAG: ParB/RepB/Spo0J family partition protein [Acutalibacteraceae bacterium]
MLNPRDIKRPQNPVRTVFDEYELSLLRDSIAASGMLQPLLVKKVSRGTYQLIAGERRLKAAIMAGLRRVPCVVHNVNETTAILYSIMENIQNRGLSAFEEAASLNMLINKKGMSMAEAAARLGVAQSTLAKKLQLLRLDDKIKDRIIAAGLTEEHARALLRLPKEGRAQALDVIISDALTAKQTEEYIFSILNPPLKPREPMAQEVREKPVRKTAIGDPRLFSNSLVKLVDTLRNSGIGCSLKKTESEKYTEYRIKIKKETADLCDCAQLRICQ